LPLAVNVFMKKRAAISPVLYATNGSIHFAGVNISCISAAFFGVIAPEKKPSTSSPPSRLI
jgi:hypothetical protein